MQIGKFVIQNILLLKTGIQLSTLFIVIGGVALAAFLYYQFTKNRKERDD